ncbi:MAG: hypothetical protein U0531_12760 [Dehalococcoidia bacterium]
MAPACPARDGPPKLAVLAVIVRLTAPACPARRLRHHLPRLLRAEGHLSAPTGEVTIAAHGLANTLLRVIADPKPTHIAVTMDLVGSTSPAITWTSATSHIGCRRRSTSCRSSPAQLVEAFNIPIYEAEGSRRMTAWAPCPQAAAQGSKPIS